MNVSGERRIRILGSEVHLVSVDRTVDYIEQWIENRKDDCRRIVVSGFHGLWEGYKDPEIRSILNSADMWVPDGIAPIWAARIRGYSEVDRSTGRDIMHGFFARANTNKYRSFFYGDTDLTLTTLQAAIEKQYPGHEVVGVFSPPFRSLTPEEDDDVIDRINAAHPDVLWVGLGMPKQELWIHERRTRLKVPVVIGVGAAFAFVAGTVQRCPNWIGSLGFEWAYRLIREPRKLWRRDMLDGPRFLVQLGLELLRPEGLIGDHIESKEA